MKLIIAFFFIIFTDIVFGQQVINKLDVKDLKLPVESASRAATIDGSNKLKSSANISTTELDYLDNVSSNIQTQINGKQASLGFTAEDVANKSTNTALGSSNTLYPSQNAVKSYADTLDAQNLKLTGNQSASGAKTFTGKIVASSTTSGFQSCPSMTQTQRDAIGAPTAGDCIYNSTSNKWNVYNGSSWKDAGGGAGGSRLELMTDPSFEDGVAEGSCSGCTATSESSVVQATPYNEKSLKLNFASGTGSYTLTKTTGAQFAGSQGVVVCRIKTDQSGVVFRSYVDGTLQETLSVPSNNIWTYFELPIVHGSTSAAWRIEATSAATLVYGDECGVRVGGVGISVSQAQTAVFGSFAIAATTSTRTSTTMGAYGTSASIPGPVYTINDWNCQTTDVDKLAFTCSNVPPGRVVVSIQATVGPSTTAVHSLAVFDGTTQSTSGPGATTAAGGVAPNVIIGDFIYTSSGSRTFELYGATATGNSVIDFSVATTGQKAVKFFIQYYPPASQVYSQACADPRTCENVFSAEVGATGTVTSESSDFISGNCTNAATRVCTLNTFGLTVGMNCTASSTTGSETIATVSASSSTSISVSTFVAGSGSAQAFKLVCQKSAPDYKATNSITGTFAEMVRAPGVSKPKTCYYAFGGASATLAAPTECTTGTCVEVVDTCAAGTPPAWATTSIYNDMTFASGTWAASSFIKCDCVAFDVTTGLVRECTQFFVTSDHTWSTNSSGGAVLNMISYDNAGSQATSYVTLECTGQAP